ncbi:hypothetical protein B0H15DRAFT_855247 [Mycena belliarum]|uniref:Uncharacterized protein n=1 Tax=Mycena belliarum TaxID=1033014 RepID=A0AAD6U152_9AGAR|nr:hypothetical protein B0H15DRAFT_855247 [Mycena belliae]
MEGEVRMEEEMKMDRVMDMEWEVASQYARVSKAIHEQNRAYWSSSSSRSSSSFLSSHPASSDCWHSSSSSSSSQASPASPSPSGSDSARSRLAYPHVHVNSSNAPSRRTPSPSARMHPYRVSNPSSSPKRTQRGGTVGLLDAVARFLGRGCS